MKSFIIFPLALLLCLGCASGANESDTKVIIDKDAEVDSVEIKTDQQAHSSTADKVQGDQTTNNADLSKGWGGMMAIRSLFVLMVGFILVLCPTMQNKKVRLLLILGAISCFMAAIYMAVKFYG
jgi:hypothetical protein